MVDCGGEGGEKGVFTGEEHPPKLNLKKKIVRKNLESSTSL